MQHLLDHRQHPKNMERGVMEYITADEMVLSSLNLR